MRLHLARYEDFPTKSEREIYMIEIEMVQNNRFIDDEEKKEKIKQLKSIVEKLKK